MVISSMGTSRMSPLPALASELRRLLLAVLAKVVSSRRWIWPSVSPLGQSSTLLM
jgi:hypothetical protein